MDDFNAFMQRANSGAGRARAATSWIDPRDEILAPRQRQTLATLPAPKEDGGLFGFVREVGKDIGGTFDRVGKGTANVIHEINGGAQKERDLQFQTQQNDATTIKTIGEKIKTAKSDEERQRLRESLSKIAQAGADQDKRTIDRQNEVIQQNDPTRGVADVASLGLDVLGAGTGASVLARGVGGIVRQAAKQGAIYGGAQSALDPIKEKGSQVTGEDIGGSAATGALGGALLGGVTGAGGQLLSKAVNKFSKGGVDETISKPGILSRLGKKIENTGDNLMGTQADLTRAEGRKIGAVPSEVLGSINKRTGVSNLDTATRVADNITGSNGAYSELVKNAVGNTTGVDIADLRKVAGKLLTNEAPLINASQRKNILEQVKNSYASSSGGDAGSLSTLSNPLDALSASQNFRTMAREIKSAANPSATDTQLAKVYDKLGKSIEEKLYKAPGVEEGLKLAAPDRARELRELAKNTVDKAESGAYIKLAKELEDPNLSVAKLRSLQSDFVKINKIGEATARAQSGAAKQLGDSMTGVGKLVQRPTNLLAVPLDAASPGIGGVLSKLGRRMQPDTLEKIAGRDKGRPLVDAESASAFGEQPKQGILNKFVNSPTVNAVAPAAQNTIIGRGVNQTPQEDVQTQQAQMIDQPIEEGQPYDMTSLSSAGPGQGTDIFSEDNIRSLILQDLQGNQGKNVDKLVKLYETFGGGGKPGKSNATTQKALTQSANGLNTLDQLESLYKEAGGGSNILQGSVQGITAGLGADKNANIYNSQRSAAIASLAKAFGDSGTLSDGDIKRYDEMLPKLTDTPEQAQGKFGVIRQRLGASQQNASMYGGGYDTEDLVNQMGGI